MKLSNPFIKQLVEEYKEISLLGRINALLSWDLNVNLPAHSAPDRAQQLAYVTNQVTNKWLDPAFRSLLEKANKQQDLTVEEKAIVHNLNRGGQFYYNVPKEIIIKKEQVTAAAFPVWNEAREGGNFKKFLPHLETIIDLDRQIADHLGYKKNPYDALLDLYEQELTAAECERLFNGMKKELVPLIKKITKSKGYVESLALFEQGNHYLQSDQEKLLRYAASDMGFDFTRGRIDISPHPFTIQLATHDVRFTVSYKTTDFRESFTAAMHEAGHGLYEQGVHIDFANTPLSGGVSLGIHEALSRFWENMVGKNPLYIRNVVPLFKTLYDKQLASIDDETIVRSFNLVKPSLIRIHADEVTYSLHIILRFEMENGLINGTIAAKDAPEVWREKSKALFGIIPESDREGVLQDVHWTYGSFGYFPSYALGNLYGAQFLNAMEKEFSFDETVKNGDLQKIKTWLDKNIHQHGSLYLPKDLVKRVTGEALNYRYFIEYLTKKYTSLYNLQ